MRIAIIGLLIGYGLGSIWNPQNYTSGFLDAFTSAPTRECRIGILQNYASDIVERLK